MSATFVVVLLTWVLFRADNLTLAGRYFGAMFGTISATPQSVLLGPALYTPLSLLAMAIAAVLVFQPQQAHDWVQQPLTWGRVSWLFPLFLISVATMYAQAFNPFLYFQF